MPRLQPLQFNPSKSRYGDFFDRLHRVVWQAPDSDLGFIALALEEAVVCAAHRQSLDIRCDCSCCKPAAVASF